MQIDPLTIAYIAMGVRNVLTPANSHTPAYERIADGEGETGLVAAAVAHAELLDTLYTQHAERFHGVHAYEVSEPFGEWFIARWMELGTEPTISECTAKARTLTLACVDEG